MKVFTLEKGKSKRYHPSLLVVQKEKEKGAAHGVNIAVKNAQMFQCATSWIERQLHRPPDHQIMGFKQGLDVAIATER